MVDVRIAVVTWNTKPVIAFLNFIMSAVAMPRPISWMVPISGEISMAPMMTAVEFVLRPMEAIRMAKNRIDRFIPLTRPPASSRDLMTS